MCPTMLAPQMSLRTTASTSGVCVARSSFQQTVGITAVYLKNKDLLHFKAVYAHYRKKIFHGGGKL